MAAIIDFKSKKVLQEDPSMILGVELEVYLPDKNVAVYECGCEPLSRFFLLTTNGPQCTCCGIIVGKESPELSSE